MSTRTVMLATVAALLLCLGLSVGDRCDSAPGVNGCSIPGGLNYFYKNIFRSDCNKHDVCYACGESRGVSRGSCDSKFYSNIRQTCRSDSRVRNRVWCWSVSFDYYLAVRVGGRRRYLGNSRSWCSQSWVQQCLQ